MTLHPHPIATAPTPERLQERVPVLLYCPKQGGWHTGLWWDGLWRLHYDLQQILEPTHWLPIPLAVVGAEAECAAPQFAA